MIDIIMKINLNKNQDLAEIKKAFTRKYPYLKIEFFKNNRLLKDNMLDDTVKLQLPDEPVSITVHDNISVAEYEALMLKLTGLHVQIFRKSGSGWLMTTTSDRLSITEINSEAEAAMHESSPANNKDFDDYHEQL